MPCPAEATLRVGQTSSRRLAFPGRPEHCPGAVHLGLNFAPLHSHIRQCIHEENGFSLARLTHAQAALDTVLVLFIVACSGALLFGMNVALAELSEWWYHLE